MDNNRIKRFQAAPELIMRLGSGKYEVIANPLPEDAKIERSYYDEDARAFTIIVQSQEFEPVLWGETIPTITPMIQRLNG